MIIEKYQIKGETYEVYEITYNGKTFRVGESRLEDLITEIIEVEGKYVETQVTNEMGETFSLEKLDDTIDVFLGDIDSYGKPTQENIIENIQELLDELINDNNFMIEHIENLVSCKINNYKNACNEMTSIICDYIKVILNTFDLNELEFTNENIFNVRMYYSHTDDFDWCEVEGIGLIKDNVCVKISSVWHDIKDMQLDTLEQLYKTIKKEIVYLNSL